MPLYATTEREAYNNIFIGYLFNYRKSLIKANEVELYENPAQVSELYTAGIYYYGKAIDYALNIVNKTNLRNMVEQVEQRDFLDWLCCNQFKILSVFNNTAIKYHNLGQEKEKENTLLQGQNYFSLIRKNSKRTTATPILKDKQTELDHAREVTERRPNKTPLRKIYLQLFCECIRTISRYRESLTSWLTDENRQWINKHYNTLTTTLTQYGTTNEKKELLAEWQDFYNIDQLAKNQEQRNSILCDGVENSIELCFKWEKKTFIEKLIAQFEEVIKNLAERAQKSLSDASIKSKALNFLGTIFGTALYPLITPILFASDKIFQKNYHSDYHQYIKNNWSTGFQLVKNHPIIFLLTVTGIIASVAVPLFTSICLAISNGVAAATLSSGLSTADVLFSMGLSMLPSIATISIISHKHAEEIEKIREQYRKTIQLNEIAHNNQIGQQKNELQQNLEANKKLHKEEEDDEANELEQYHMWRKQHITNSKRIEKKPESTNNTSITVIQKEALEIFNAMNNSDIREAQQEIHEVLNNCNTLLTNINQEKQITESKLAEGRNQLDQLEVFRMALIESMPNTSPASIIIINPNNNQATISHASLIDSFSEIFNYPQPTDDTTQALSMEPTQPTNTI